MSICTPERVFRDASLTKHLHPDFVRISTMSMRRSTSKRDNSIDSENTVPSSPSAAVFSDGTQHASSPPSSPPGFPWEQIKAPDTVKESAQDISKNAFSVLGKRKALDSSSNNVRPLKKSATQAPKAVPPLTQMQISLGQETQKRCKTCGMEYSPSSSEDRKLHDRYHKQNTEGYDVGKDFVQHARPNSTYDVGKAGEIICSLDCFDKPARKKRGQDALEVVQREMGAIAIPEKSIWDSRESSSPVHGDYIAYLYIRGTKCIGYLLVQKIKEAHLVVEPAMSHDQRAKSKVVEENTKRGAKAALAARREHEAQRLQELARLPLQLSRQTTSATLGISRIWTSATHRNQNIASTLLDTAFTVHRSRARQTSSGHTEDEARSGLANKESETQHQEDRSRPPFESSENKDLVAFSQPTDAGTRLARRWFGTMFGWKVYTD